MIIVQRLLVKQANTDEPYKNTFRIGVLPTIEPTPITKIPVPKKKDDAMDTPKYLRKITLRKVYKLAQPRDIIILPRIAQSKLPTLTSKDVRVSSPATIAPNKYVTHMHAIANVQESVLEIM